MAKKRPSLKDKNVFKRNTDTVDEATEPASVENDKPEATPAEPPNVAVDVPLSSGQADLSVDSVPEALVADAVDTIVAIETTITDTPPEDMPANEADLDFSAMAELEADEIDDVDLGLSPALEIPPIGEADLGFFANRESSIASDTFDFPPALELEDELDFPPALEPDDDLGFPPALESALPSDDVSTNGLSAGEADLASGEADLPFDEFNFADFPESEIVDLPVGEAGLDVADTGVSFEPDIPFDFGGLPENEDDLSDWANVNDFDFPSQPDITVRPDPTPVSLPPSNVNDVTPVVSEPQPQPQLTPLTLGDDAPEDILDFIGVADEPATLEYEIPTDFEGLSEEERMHRVRLLNDQFINAQFTKLYEEIDIQYEKILTDNVSSNKEITDWAHNLLAETRFIIMNYQIEDLPKAEWNIQQVKARLDRAEESEIWRKRWASRIIAWGFVWFVVFIILVFRPDPILPLLTSQIEGDITDVLDSAVFLRTIFFGGIGGVTAVFYSLLKYVSRRSYDKEYNLSYFVKPFMGMVVGTLVYLIVYVVARLFGITPAPINSDPSIGNIIFQSATYSLAVAAGFKENVAFQLLSRMMKVVLRDNRDDEPEPASMPPPPASTFSP